MRQILFLLTLIFTTSIVFGQNKLAGINYTFFPEAKIKDENVPDTKLTFSETKFFFSIPKTYNDKATVMLNGIDYTYVHSLVDGDDDRSSNLHKISYSFGLVQQLTEEWKVTSFLIPTLASDFREGIDSDDFIMQAAVSFIRKKSETFTYGLGLSINTRFGEPLLMPLFQLKKKYAKTEVDMILPAYISVLRRSNKIYYGGALVVNGGQFNTHRKQADGTYLERVDYSRVLLGPKVLYRINKFLVAEVYGGAVAGRTYKIKNDLDSRFDFSLENGGFLQFGIYMIPDLDN